MGDALEVQPATQACRSIGIERVSSLDGLLELAVEWRALFEAGGLDVFGAWEWQMPWWRHLTADSRLWLLVARDEAGRALGIVPLSLERARIGLLHVRRLGFLGDNCVGSDYLDVIATDEWRSAVIQAVAGYLAAHADEWDVIEWRDMDARSRSAMELATCLGPEHVIESRPMGLCPVQHFSHDEPFDDFLQRTRRCSNYLRRLRWLQRQPGYRIDICQGDPGLAEAQDIFFRLHAQRWAEDGGSAGIPDEAVRAFHVEATRRLAEHGQVIFYTLWVGGTAV
ncbi:MAG: GNAT family N-acetyltransferase, partial [Wenzhouxiangellaceae bacterium]